MKGRHFGFVKGQEWFKLCHLSEEVYEIRKLAFMRVPFGRSYKKSNI